MPKINTIWQKEQNINVILSHIYKTCCHFVYLMVAHNNSSSPKGHDHLELNGLSSLHASPPMGHDLESNSL
jgi:hypothetical protein